MRSVDRDARRNVRLRPSEGWIGVQVDEKDGKPEETERMVDEFRRDIYRGWHTGFGAYAGPLFICGILWAMYLLKRFAGFELYDWLHPERRRYNRHPIDFTPFYLGAAIVGTVVAVIVGRVNSMKAGKLLRSGVETTGTIVAQTGLTKHGMSPTTIAYVVDGRELRFRKDLPRDLYQVGDKVRILYDPQRPRSRDIMGKA